MPSIASSIVYEVHYVKSAEISASAPGFVPEPCVLEQELRHGLVEICSTVGLAGGELEVTVGPVEHAHQDLARVALHLRRSDAHDPTVVERDPRRELVARDPQDAGLLLELEHLEQGRQAELGELAA